MTDRNEDFQRGYALGRRAAYSLENAIRALTDRTNELTILMQAIIKKLGTNPQELLELLKPEDFVNVEDEKNVEGTARTILVPDGVSGPAE